MKSWVKLQKALSVKTEVPFYLLLWEEKRFKNPLANLKVNNVCIIKSNCSKLVNIRWSTVVTLPL
jgi:hypothetical protein